MRPIAHARRQSSRAALSRHAVDAVVVGNPVPLGIPALFLADQLSRGRTGERILSGKRGLIAEYAGAEGYAYAWGHLIEQRLGRSVLWRVVPVALWERLSDVRAESPLLIEELLTLMQPRIPPALEPHLPSGVVARGCQGASRHSPATAAPEPPEPSVSHARSGSRRRIRKPGAQSSCVRVEARPSQLPYRAQQCRPQERDHNEHDGCDHERPLDA